MRMLLTHGAGSGWKLARVALEDSFYTCYSWTIGLPLCSAGVVRGLEDEWAGIEWYRRGYYLFIGRVSGMMGLVPYYISMSRTRYSYGMPWITIGLLSLVIASSTISSEAFAAIFCLVISTLIVLSRQDGAKLWAWTTICCGLTLLNLTFRPLILIWIVGAKLSYSTHLTFL